MLVTVLEALSAAVRKVVVVVQLAAMAQTMVMMIWVPAVVVYIFMADNDDEGTADQ